MLTSKQLPKNLIQKSLAKIDMDEYKQILDMLLNKKINSISTTDEYQKTYHLRYYLSSHGFENELIEEAFENNNV